MVELVPLSMETKKMTTVNAINNIGYSSTDAGAPLTSRTLRRWTAALFLSVLFGAVSGLGCVVVGFVTLGEFVVASTGFYTTGTILLGLTFVLFGLAAHSLDKVDAADKAMRLDYCRRHGLRD